MTKVPPSLEEEGGLGGRGGLQFLFIITTAWMLERGRLGDLRIHETPASDTIYAFASPKGFFMAGTLMTASTWCFQHTNHLVSWTIGSR